MGPARQCASCTKAHPPASTNARSTPSLPPRVQAGLEPTHQVLKLAREAGFNNVHDYLVHLTTGGHRQLALACHASVPVLAASASTAGTNVLASTCPHRRGSTNLSASLQGHQHATVIGCSCCAGESVEELKARKLQHSWGGGWRQGGVRGPTRWSRRAATRRATRRRRRRSGRQVDRCTAGLRPAGNYVACWQLRTASCVPAIELTAMLHCRCNCAGGGQPNEERGHRPDPQAAHDEEAQVEVMLAGTHTCTCGARSWPTWRGHRQRFLPSG